MPTAAVAKLEKQGSLDANDPLRQGIVMVEHKIRNLEKRKAKLDGYRDLQKNGKDLNSDQLEAISKYDAVIQHLDFARELSKHLTSLALEAVKNTKKQARKEAQEKAQQDLARTKEMLMIQEVLSSMGQENVREDFLQGKAKVILTAEELQHIDDLYIELTLKREEHVHFQDMFQGPAEVMSHLLDGKNKEVVGTTFSALKTKLLEIAKSGYFDNPQPEQEQQQPAVVTEEVAAVAEEIPVATTISAPVAPAPAVPVSVHVPVAAPPPTLPTPQIACNFQPGLVNQIPANVQPPQQHVHVAPQPVPVQVPIVNPVTVPEPVPVQQIETTYFTPSHLRVFQSGTIDFMQDNELDTPEHIEAPPSIPTMTYTNQSYTAPVVEASQPVPPVPVVAAPAQPEPPQIYQNQTEEEKGWSHVGGADGHHQTAPQPVADEGDEWAETGVTAGPGEDSWASQAEQQWSQAQPQHNDGFITQGGRGRGGRGSRGGDRNPKGGNFNSGRGGGRGGNRGGYNNREGGGYNREGGYGGGNYKDQNSYQNGYQNRNERGGRGRGGGASNDRQGGGRGRGGGNRPGGGGGYRGGNPGGSYRQQQ